MSSTETPAHITHSYTENNVSFGGTLSNQPLPIQWQIPMQFTIELKITPHFPIMSSIQSNGTETHQILEDLDIDESERAFDYSTREGYSEKFLGDDLKYSVPLPGLSSILERDAAEVITGISDSNNYELKYQHFSVIMNKKRRMPFLTAVNIDGNQLRRIPRGGDKWYIDPRIERQYQFGNELYSKNDLDRGHMVRRLDPVWGPKAEIANEDTFHYTNACPQHKNLNQKTWNNLEDYILDNADVLDLKVSVFTGPVFRADDITYRNAKIPREFWKVAVLVDSQTNELSATAYLLSQADMISNLEFAYGQFRTYQISLAQVEALTDLNFGTLKDFDPIRTSTTESIGKKIIERPQDIIFR